MLVWLHLCCYPLSLLYRYPLLSLHPCLCPSWGPPLGCSLPVLFRRLCPRSLGVSAAACVCLFHTLLAPLVAHLPKAPPSVRPACQPQPQWVMMGFVCLPFLVGVAPGVVERGGMLVRAVQARVYVLRVSPVHAAPPASAGRVGVTGWPRCAWAYAWRAFSDTCNGKHRLQSPRRLRAIVCSLGFPRPLPCLPRGPGWGQRPPSVFLIPGPL